MDLNKTENIVKDKNVNESINSKNNKNSDDNKKSDIKLENFIVNDKYTSNVGITLIPFSQLSNKQFNNYLRAIGR